MRSGRKGKGLFPRCAGSRVDGGFPFQAGSILAGNSALSKHTEDRCLLQGAPTNIDNNRDTQGKCRRSNVVGACLKFPCLSGKWIEQLPCSFPGKDICALI